MGRPLSLDELRRNIQFAPLDPKSPDLRVKDKMVAYLSSNKTSFLRRGDLTGFANLAGHNFEGELSFLKREGLVVSSGAHLTLKNTMEFLGAAEEKSRFFERKIESAKKLRFIFRFIPFVDFVLVAGSLAFGAPRDHSDIDVVVGAREGRIFTVRFFASFFAWFLDFRRGSYSSKEEGRDKICFNHFVTPRGYELRPPRDLYWRVLYRNLIPFYGDKNAALNFLEANKWAPADAQTWKYFLAVRKSWFCRALEAVFGGWLGNILESLARSVQLFKFERSRKHIREDFHPRVYFGDDELEFHPDTRRIREYLEKSEMLIRELTT